MAKLPEEFVAAVAAEMKRGTVVPFEPFTRKPFQPSESVPPAVLDESVDARVAKPAIKPADDTADLLQGFVFDGSSPIAPPAMLVSGLLPMDGIAVIGGQSGAGKTFVLVNLSVRLASGTAFFGRKVRERVGVAILAPEGASTLKLRVEVARRNQLGADHYPLPIAWLGDVPDLSDPKEIDAMIPRLEALDRRFQADFGVRLGAVAFDTLAATFALDDENSNSESSAICRQLRRLGNATGALMLPVHHYGKGVETGLRGASGWRANTDAVISVLADRNQITGKVSKRSLALAKSRTHEEGSIAGFSLHFVEIGTDEDGDPFGACFVESAEGVPGAETAAPTAKLTKGAQIALRALQEAIEESSSLAPASNHIPAKTRVILIDHWRERSYKHGISDSTEPRARQVAFKRAYDNLLAAKRIGVWDGHAWLV